MIAIIPAKASSIRLPNKNFLQFADKKSLCEIQIEKLLKVMSSNKIYLSSEDEEKRVIADFYNINFLLRDKRLTDNNISIDTVIREVYKQTGEDDDLAWCQVINPFFNDYKACFSLWEETIDRSIYDSLVVAYETSGYLLDSNCYPINFMYGPWHLPSQKLRPFYEMTFTFSILRRDIARTIGYYVGRNPYWYHLNEPHVDIDTYDDFAIAQIMYSYFKRKD